MEGKLKIKKSISLILILFSFFTIAPKSAFAQPATGDPNANDIILNFTDSNQSQIIMRGKLGNREKSNLFSYDDNLSNYIISNKDKLARYGGSEHLSTYGDNFKAFRIVAGENADKLNYLITDCMLDYEGNICKNPAEKGYDFATKMGPFLVIGGLGSGTSKQWINLGFYELENNSQRLTSYKDNNANIVKIQSPLFIQSMYEPKGGNSQDKDELLSYLANLSNYFCGTALGNLGVGSDISKQDVGTLCKELDNNWTSLKNLVRNFFIPIEKGKVQNENWSNKQDSWGERVISGVTFRNNMLALGVKLGLSEDVLNSALTDEYKVTVIGETNASTIYQRGEDIKSIIAKLKQVPESERLSGGTKDWPCGTVNELKPFKWNLTLENTATAIKSLDELETGANEITKLFEQFKETQDAPIGENDKCKISDTDVGLSSLISQAFCGFVVVIKGWADWFFCWAAGLMEKVIGVVRNEEQDVDDPLKDSTINTSLDKSCN